ncbi:universal stress protein [Mucilaginibacter sp. BT774]|uniref:universal stress protein n=1 Tax=Mucilaginibacter sp. BT774 TaxID=3062276 RepID=UPI00267513C0|nr:universal stress protein [Mucilaginibacter sp. BT774]MDO3628196.1 universal stress protein [Mucilaginibacter sp. BT774]
MKKISAAFDGLKFSESTLTYAIKLAHASKAMLSGIFLESFLYHGYKMQDLVGAHGISEVKMRHLLEKDTETRLKSSAVFEQACKNAGIKYAVHHDESFALQELVKESIYSDLVLISADETLRHATEKRPTHFLRELLSQTQCPVLIVPDKYTEVEKVVLLYDGRPSSVYAIKMFNYMMPWLQNKETEVVSVTDPKDMIDLPDQNLVEEFIKCHYPGATYTLLKGDPEEEIVNYLKSGNLNSLVVSGAYQRGQVSRWFKSSMADRLMGEINMPLFIAHY